MTIPVGFVVAAAAAVVVVVILIFASSFFVHSCEQPISYQSLLDHLCLPYVIQLTHAIAADKSLDRQRFLHHKYSNDDLPSFHYQSLLQLRLPRLVLYQ
ncbi:hypothetical protein G6F68_021094 [Rhizopus microsporus]|nr:hypothetical protein G6F68_021094 [Rhizopus microsporus]